MKIIKLGYSRAPWRLVTSDGKEVYLPQAMDHASLGMTVINGPICGNSKAECTENALALLESILSVSKREMRNSTLEEAAQRCDPTNQPDDWTEYAKNRAECADNIRAMKA